MVTMNDEMREKEGLKPLDRHVQYDHRHTQHDEKNVEVKERNTVRR